LATAFEFGETAPEMPQVETTHATVPEEPVKPQAADTVAQDMPSEDESCPV